jgi:hypothetical protein
VARDRTCAARPCNATHDFTGAPGNGILESHGQFAYADFWYDPNHPFAGSGGSNVAYGEGAECMYFGPNAQACHGAGT